jgi:NDP-sugar pyrophosphorylase family protein
LSTIGPLRLIPDLPENFLLMNGDVLTDLDFGCLYCDHVANGNLFTVAASRRVQTIDYGVLTVDESLSLSGFNEKPRIPYLVSMGVYAVNRSVLEMAPPGKAYGFDNLMLDLLARGDRVAVRPYDGYWLDIGRPDDYNQAIDEFESMKSALLYE